MHTGEHHTAHLLTLALGRLASESSGKMCNRSFCLEAHTNQNWGPSQTLGWYCTFTISMTVSRLSSKALCRALRSLLLLQQLLMIIPFAVSCAPHYQETDSSRCWPPEGLDLFHLSSSEPALLVMCAPSWSWDISICSSSSAIGN